MVIQWVREILLQVSIHCTGTFSSIAHTHRLCFQFNPFPNKPWFSRVCSTSLLKALCEKEELLVTSNFSLSHSVFNPFREHSAISIKF